MKQTVLAVAVLATIGLAACSSTKPINVSSGTQVNPGNQQAISEQRLQNDFKRQGVRVIYSITGEVINDGKTVRAVYRWEAKHQGPRLQIRNQMAM